MIADWCPLSMHFTSFSRTFFTRGGGASKFQIFVFNRFCLENFHSSQIRPLLSASDNG